jgi:head-tail adaptor
MTGELAGALREQVTIETWVAARDDAGADAGFWRLERTVFAAVVLDAGGSRAVEGAARRSGQRWQVTMRGPAAIGLTSRLLWAGRILSVLSVATDPRQPDRLVLRCTADAA